MKPTNPEYLTPYLVQVEVVMNELSALEWEDALDEIFHMWNQPKFYPLFSYVRLDGNKSRALYSCGCITQIKNKTMLKWAHGYDNKVDKDLTLKVRALQGVPEGFNPDQLEAVGVTNLDTLKDMLLIFANAQAALQEMRSTHEQAST